MKRLLNVMLATPILVLGLGCAMRQPATDPNVPDTALLPDTEWWQLIIEVSAAVSVVAVAIISVRGAWNTVWWLVCRTNKRLRFMALKDEASTIWRAFSHRAAAKERIVRVGQQSRTLEGIAIMLENAFHRQYTPSRENLETLADMCRDLQHKLTPLNVYLFSEAEMSVYWLGAKDKPLNSGHRRGDGSIVTYDEMGRERQAEMGRTLTLIRKLMREGNYRKAKQEFPSAYDGARLRFSNEIKAKRTERVLEMMETHRMTDKRPMTGSDS